MTEQKKREDVIKGLEQFVADFKPFCGNRADWQRVYDALAMLKAQEQEVVNLQTKVAELTTAQEPMVLTYDEARNHAMQFMNPDSIKPLFIEFRIKDDDDEEELRPPWRGGYNQRLMLMDQKDRYGVDFRFWTDRPSVEQMEAAAWE